MPKRTRERNTTAHSPSVRTWVDVRTGYAPTSTSPKPASTAGLVISTQRGLRAKVKEDRKG
jgi:hypothetical protein